ncbi:MAG: hypothetical protein ACK5AZ_20825 [Bryobacteraceae bacterium]
MKASLALLLMACVFSLNALAAGIDGNWLAESKIQTPNGDEITIQSTLNLKSDGNSLTGTVVTNFRGTERRADVKNGKLDGNKFSFSTTTQGPQGEFTTEWEGTVDEDQIKGSRSGFGGRTFPFTAKRQ